ncbi:hypothetical protein IAU59_004016 [Kwoniella sp. CBS 9459]
MTITQAEATAAKAPLTYRIAKEVDYALLVQMRIECGWGVPKLAQRWKDPNSIFCVLEANMPQGKEDVGMACWLLEDGDPSIASRSQKCVHIASLFIRRQFQRSGFGSKAMDLLEQEAVDKYGAEWITLDTTAYYTEQTDGKHFVEDMTRPGKSIGWYKSRGFVEFKDPKPSFPHGTPDNPDRLLWAAYLRKNASQVRL